MLLELYDGADGLVEEVDGISFGEGQNELFRFVPRVFGESELVMMDGEDGFGIEVPYGAFQTFGRGVYQRPVAVILPVLQKCQIDLSELFVHTFETTVIASIAADIDLATVGLDHERSPKRLIASTK